MQVLHPLRYENSTTIVVGAEEHATIAGAGVAGGVHANTSSSEGGAGGTSQGGGVRIDMNDQEESVSRSLVPLWRKFFFTTINFLPRTNTRKKISIHAMLMY